MELKKIKYILSLILLLSFLNVHSQNTERFDQDQIKYESYEEDWNKITSGKSYPKPANEIKKKKKVNKHQEKKDLPKKDYSSSNSVKWFSGGFATYLAYGLAIVLVIFLLYYAFKNQTRSSNIKIKTLSQDLDIVAEEIHEHDLDAILREALKNGDFRSALRIYFLIAVKTLSEGNQIDWKKDKTNYDYLNEIASISLQNQFQYLTLTYEKVWFGDFDFDESIYYKVEGSYKNFINEVQQISQTQKPEENE